MTLVVGYTRPLVAGDHVDADIATLHAVGVSEVVAERLTGARGQPALDEQVARLSAGDVLVVSSAARLAPSMTGFVSTSAGLAGRGIRLRCMAEPALSTDTAAVFSGAEWMLALEALRRGLLSARTRDGLAAAATDGRRPGRPSVMSDQRVTLAVEMRRQGRSYAHIARILGVSDSAVRRALATASPT